MLDLSISQPTISSVLQPTVTSKHSYTHTHTHTHTHVSIHKG